MKINYSILGSFFGCLLYGNYHIVKWCFGGLGFGVGLFRGRGIWSPRGLVRGLVFTNLGFGFEVLVFGV